MNTQPNHSPERSVPFSEQRETAKATDRQPTSIGRREFLKGAAASATVMPFAMSAVASQASAARQNVVYLFSDEHRYQSMSFTETPAVKTPNMARMAKEGASFEYAISNNPVCTPYRAMLLTGRWCYSSGMLENHGTLAPWDRTIAHVFNEAGYTTGYTGKWHLGSNAHLAGFDWHMNWSNTNDHWDSAWTDLHGSGETTPCDQYNATTMTDQALEFIESSAETSNPFLLMVSWNPPHAVFTDPPPDKKDLYPSPEELPWRENAQEEKKDRQWNSYQGYHAHVTAIDEEIGRVMKKLKQLGIADNTIVVYSADHGSMMNSHGMGNKRFPQEESIRVPFLVRHPQGVPAGQIRKELFGTIDIVPTLCGLAGLSVPSFCEGEDFSPNLRGEPGPDPDSQFLMHIGRKDVTEDPREHHTPFFRGVRGKRFTYSVESDGPAQLYDNESDPYQMNNLIDDPAHVDTRRRLQAQLDGWIARAEDPYMHADYHAMPLGERIHRQALLHCNGGFRLKEFLSQLKLSPAQEDQLKAIDESVYDKSGRPLIKGGRQAWENAAEGHREKIKAILTREQREEFERLELLEKAALGT